MRQAGTQDAGLGVTEIARTHLRNCLEWKRPNGGLKKSRVPATLEPSAKSRSGDASGPAESGGRGPRREDLSQPTRLNPNQSSAPSANANRWTGVGGRRKWRAGGAPSTWRAITIWVACAVRRELAATGCGAAIGNWRVSSGHRRLGTMQRREMLGLGGATSSGNAPAMDRHNGRFLILPWVRVKGLASKILALSARHVPSDCKPDMGIVPYCWKPLVARGASAEHAIAPANWLQCRADLRARSHGSGTPKAR